MKEEIHLSGNVSTLGSEEFQLIASAVPGYILLTTRPTFVWSSTEMTSLF